MRSDDSKPKVKAYTVRYRTNYENASEGLGDGTLTVREASAKNIAAACSPTALSKFQKNKTNPDPLPNGFMLLSFEGLSNGSEPIIVVGDTTTPSNIDQLYKNLGAGIPLCLAYQTTTEAGFTSTELQTLLNTLINPTGKKSTIGANAHDHFLVASALGEDRTELNQWGKFRKIVAWIDDKFDGNVENITLEKLDAALASPFFGTKGALAQDGFKKNDPEIAAFKQGLAITAKKRQAREELEAALSKLNAETEKLNGPAVRATDSEEILINRVQVIDAVASAKETAEAKIKSAKQALSDIAITAIIDSKLGSSAPREGTAASPTTNKLAALTTKIDEEKTALLDALTAKYETAVEEQSDLIPTEDKLKTFNATDAEKLKSAIKEKTAEIASLHGTVTSAYTLLKEHAPESVTTPETKESDLDTINTYTKTLQQKNVSILQEIGTVQGLLNDIQRKQKKLGIENSESAVPPAEELETKSLKELEETSKRLAALTQEYTQQNAQLKDQVEAAIKEAQTAISTVLTKIEDEVAKLSRVSLDGLFAQNTLIFGAIAEARAVAEKLKILSPNDTLLADVESKAKEANDKITEAISTAMAKAEEQMRAELSGEAGVEREEAETVERQAIHPLQRKSLSDAEERARSDISAEETISRDEIALNIASINTLIERLKSLEANEQEERSTMMMELDEMHQDLNTKSDFLKELQSSFSANSSSLTEIEQQQRTLIEKEQADLLMQLHLIDQFFVEMDQKRSAVIDSEDAERRTIKERAKLSKAELEKREELSRELTLAQTNLHNFVTAASALNADEKKSREALLQQEDTVRNHLKEIDRLHSVLHTELYSSESLVETEFQAALLIAQEQMLRDALIKQEEYISQVVLTDSHLAKSRAIESEEGKEFADIEKFEAAAKFALAKITKLRGELEKEPRLREKITTIEAEERKTIEASLKEEVLSEIQKARDQGNLCSKNLSTITSEVMALTPELEVHRDALNNLSSRIGKTDVNLHVALKEAREIKKALAELNQRILAELSETEERKSITAEFETMLSRLAAERNTLNIFSDEEAARTVLIDQENLIREQMNLLIQAEHDMRGTFSGATEELKKLETLKGSAESALAEIQKRKAQLEQLELGARSRLETDESATRNEIAGAFQKAQDEINQKEREKLEAMQQTFEDQRKGLSDEETVARLAAHESETEGRLSIEAEAARLIAEQRAKEQEIISIKEKIKRATATAREAIRSVTQIVPSGTTKPDWYTKASEIGANDSLEAQVEQFKSKLPDHPEESATANELQKRLDILQGITGAEAEPLVKTIDAKRKAAYVIAEANNHLLSVGKAFQDSTTENSALITLPEGKTTAFSQARDELLAKVSQATSVLNDPKKTSAQAELENINKEAAAFAQEVKAALEFVKLRKYLADSSLQQKLDEIQKNGSPELKDSALAAFNEAQSCVIKAMQACAFISNDGSVIATFDPALVPKKPADLNQAIGAVAEARGKVEIAVYAAKKQAEETLEVILEATKEILNKICPQRTISLHENEQSYQALKGRLERELRVHPNATLTDIRDLIEKAKELQEDVSTLHQNMGDATRAGVKKELDEVKTCLDAIKDEIKKAKEIITANASITAGGKLPEKTEVLHKQIETLELSLGDPGATYSRANSTIHGRFNNIATNIDKSATTLSDLRDMSKHMPALIFDAQKSLNQVKLAVTAHEVAMLERQVNYLNNLDGSIVPKTEIEKLVIQLKEAQEKLKAANKAADPKSQENLSVSDISNAVTEAEKAQEIFRSAVSNAQKSATILAKGKLSADTAIIKNKLPQVKAALEKIKSSSGHTPVMIAALEESFKKIENTNNEMIALVGNPTTRLDVLLKNHNETFLIANKNLEKLEKEIATTQKQLNDLAQKKQERIERLQKTMGNLIEKNSTFERDAMKLELPATLNNNSLTDFINETQSKLRLLKDEKVKIEGTQVITEEQLANLEKMVAEESKNTAPTEQLNKLKLACGAINSAFEAHEKTRLRLTINHGALVDAQLNAQEELLHLQFEVIKRYTPAALLTTQANTTDHKQAIAAITNATKEIQAINTELDKIEIAALRQSAFTITAQEPKDVSGAIEATKKLLAELKPDDSNKSLFEKALASKTPLDLLQDKLAKLENDAKKQGADITAIASQVQDIALQAAMMVKREEDAFHYRVENYFGENAHGLNAYHDCLPSGFDYGVSRNKLTEAFNNFRSNANTTQLATDLTAVIKTATDNNAAIIIAIREPKRWLAEAHTAIAEGIKNIPTQDNSRAAEKFSALQERLAALSQEINNYPKLLTPEHTSAFAGVKDKISVLTHDVLIANLEQYATFVQGWPEKGHPGYSPDKEHTLAAIKSLIEKTHKVDEGLTTALKIGALAAIDVERKKLIDETGKKIQTLQIPPVISDKHRIKLSTNPTETVDSRIVAGVLKESLMSNTIATEEGRKHKGVLNEGNNISLYAGFLRVADNGQLYGYNPDDSATHASPSETEEERATQLFIHTESDHVDFGQVIAERLTQLASISPENRPESLTLNFAMGSDNRNHFTALAVTIKFDEDGAASGVSVLETDSLRDPKLTPDKLDASTPRVSAIEAQIKSAIKLSTQDFPFEYNVASATVKQNLNTCADFTVRHILDAQGITGTALQNAKQTDANAMRRGLCDLALKYMPDEVLIVGAPRENLEEEQPEDSVQSRGRNHLDLMDQEQRQEILAKLAMHWGTPEYSRNLITTWKNTDYDIAINSAADNDGHKLFYYDEKTQTTTFEYDITFTEKKKDDTSDSESPSQSDSNEEEKSKASSLKVVGTARKDDEDNDVTDWRFSCDDARVTWAMKQDMLAKQTAALRQEQIPVIKAKIDALLQTSKDSSKPLTPDDQKELVKLQRELSDYRNGAIGLQILDPGAEQNKKLTDAKGHEVSLTTKQYESIQAHMKHYKTVTFEGSVFNSSFKNALGITQKDIPVLPSVIAPQPPSKEPVATADTTLTGKKP